MLSERMEYHRHVEVVKHESQSEVSGSQLVPPDCEYTKTGEERKFLNLGQTKMKVDDR